MQYRQLGRTGLKVSSLCCGCGTFGWRIDQAESFRIVERAIDAGINFFDTANFYGEGNSEVYLGGALRTRGKREHSIIATKVQMVVDPSDPNGGGISRRHIIEQCEASLKRLGTDYIDLYQFHRAMSEIAIDESLRAMDDLIRSGKVRYVGTSTFAAWQIVESLWASKELGLHRVVCEQPPYNLLDRRIERELLPMARTHGIGIITWSPLGFGLLSGKYSKEEVARRNRWNDLHGQRSEALDAAFAVIDAVTQIAREKGCSPSQLAIAWCAAQPGVTCPIIGIRSMDQLEDSLGALEVEISQEEHRRIDDVIPAGNHALEFYHGDFGPHLHRW